MAGLVLPAHALGFDVENARAPRALFLQGRLEPDDARADNGDIEGCCGGTGIGLNLRHGIDAPSGIIGKTRARG
jgi:hypothetical protein